MTLPQNLKMLDKLIKKYYDTLVKTAEQHAKLEGLIKMIELRHKLAPADSDRKEFWKMLDEIRNEKLPRNARSEASEKAATGDTAANKPAPRK
jgi:hypothetical protein